MQYSTLLLAFVSVAQANIVCQPVPTSFVSTYLQHQSNLSSDFNSSKMTDKVSMYGP
ncbi:hypothetical protein Vi05172_g10555 [Venturia inaequalis]|nr:hypothetical protein Vi05172_g10555 [Venturia inaequalis]